MLTFNEGTRHKAFGAINGPPVARLPGEIVGTVDEEIVVNCNVEG